LEPLRYNITALALNAHLRHNRGRESSFVTEHAHAKPDAHAISERLARAEADCARRGVRLTAQRRDVLRFILEAGEPIGAYALLDRLKAETGGGKPPTVYRALEFLLAQGLIHRVERLNAFVGCHDETTHQHAAQFLICRQCGRVKELESAQVEAAIAAAAEAAGFSAARATVEVDGVCVTCAR
jgi:Fur family zinc uptake transcriptional regulator